MNEILCSPFHNIKSLRRRKQCNYFIIHYLLYIWYFDARLVFLNEMIYDTTNATCGSGSMVHQYSDFQRNFIALDNRSIHSYFVRHF